MARPTRRQDPGPHTAERRKLIEQLLSERQETGESYRELSERSGVPAPTIAWWRRKLRDEIADTEEIQLLEVESPRWCTGAWTSLEVVLPGGVIVRVPEGFDSDSLRRVLDAVTDRC